MGKMSKRKSIVAGQFYPSEHGPCINEIEQYTKQIISSKLLPKTIVAGIVPHAGWAFSGSLAALVFSAIKQQHEKVHTFVIFGAAHSYFGPVPAVDNSNFWQTPLGNVAVDTDLAECLLDNKLVVSDALAHKSEHSIEVQVPFIQYLFQDAEILPIIVPPDKQAISLGEAFGDIMTPAGKKIVCIGSTDLTHYGPRYGFTPMGTSLDALKWASSVNDQQFIDSALKLEPQALLASAAENCNACGAGAAAATIASARKLGKTEGLLLAHTNSNEVMQQKMATTSTDSVGYAAMVF